MDYDFKLLDLDRWSLTFDTLVQYGEEFGTCNVSQVSTSPPSSQSSSTSPLFLLITLIYLTSFHSYLLSPFVLILLVFFPLLFI